jgi:SAM-dependent methyltransferase
MTRIDIPARFHRNSPNVVAIGVEHTGSTLIDCGNELLGCSDLSDKDVLDIGCGVRFTQTIINRGLPVRSYTGIDIDEPMIDYLAANVRDSRFSFHYWHVYNERYNRGGQRLTRGVKLPLEHDRTFDVVWMYSVITHNDPEAAECLFHVARRHVRHDGALLFSAFVDNGIEAFDDRVKGHPLAAVYYNEAFLTQIISRTGWRVESVYGKKPDTVMQDLFLCRPRPLA